MACNFANLPFECFWVFVIDGKPRKFTEMRRKETCHSLRFQRDPSNEVIPHMEPFFIIRLKDYFLKSMKLVTSSYFISWGELRQHTIVSGVFAVVASDTSSFAGAVVDIRRLWFTVNRYKRCNNCLLL